MREGGGAEGILICRGCNSARLRLGLRGPRLSHCSGRSSLLRLDELRSHASRLGLRVVDGLPCLCTGVEGWCNMGGFAVSRQLTGETHQTHSSAWIKSMRRSTVVFASARSWRTSTFPHSLKTGSVSFNRSSSWQWVVQRRMAGHQMSHGGGPVSLLPPSPSRSRSAAIRAASGSR